MAQRPAAPSPQATVSTTAAELRALQAQFEEAISAHQAETAALLQSLREAVAERSVASREVERLRAQLREAQEELATLHRELRGSEDSREGLRRTAEAARRALSAEALEKGVLQRSGAELWAALRRAEQEKARSQRSKEEKEQEVLVLEAARAEAQKEASELQARLQEAERAGAHIRRELQELGRQVKTLEAENRQKGREVHRLQDQCAQGAQRQRQEALERQRQTAAAEAAREKAQKEVLRLQRRLAEVEAGAEAQARQTEAQLRESRGTERTLRAELHGASRKLQRASDAAEGLRARLHGACHQVHSLERELARAEGARQDTQGQLDRLWATLCRELGLRAQSPLTGPERPGSPRRGPGGSQGHSGQHSGSLAARPCSPPRRPPPAPGQHGPEVDVAAVQLALRDLVRQLRDAWWEQDTWRSQVASLSRWLQEEQSHAGQLHRALAQAEEGWRQAEGEAGGAQAARALQEAALRRLEAEHLASVRSAGQERRRLQEELDALHQALDSSRTHSQGLARRSRLLEDEVAGLERRCLVAESALGALRQASGRKEPLDQKALRQRRPVSARPPRPRSEPCGAPRPREGRPGERAPDQPGRSTTGGGGRRSCGSGDHAPQGGPGAGGGPRTLTPGNPPSPTAELPQPCDSGLRRRGTAPAGAPVRQRPRHTGSPPGRTDGNRPWWPGPPPGRLPRPQAAFCALGSVNTGKHSENISTNWSQKQNVPRGRAPPPTSRGCGTFRIQELQVCPGDRWLEMTQCSRDSPAGEAWV